MRGATDDTTFVTDQLSEEFAERVDAETIRGVAIQAVAAFEDARVRDYIGVIALRMARAELEQCGS